MGCTASRAVGASAQECPMHAKAASQTEVAPSDKVDASAPEVVPPQTDTSLEQDTSSAQDDVISMEPSLFEKLGGADAVEAAVDIFYGKIEADEELAPFFEGIDMKRQRHKQANFMTFAFGGSKHYSGATLHAAHKKLIEQDGLQERHFDMVAGHLIATLQELNVPQNLIDEVVAVVLPTKAMIFGDGGV